MGFILEDIIHVNKNITKPVLDTSWLGGTLKYADSYDNLVVDPNFVKPGNIGIVNDGSVTSLYSAKVKDNKVTWKPLSISGSNIDIDPVQGDSGVYYDSSIVNSWTQQEMESHPAEILVVDEDNVKPDFDPYGMFSSMMAEIHALRQEVNILRNSLNDLHGGNIADTNSNYATYMHKLEKEGNTEATINYSTPRPNIEINWKDSSATGDPSSDNYDPTVGENIYNGISEKYFENHLRHYNNDPLFDENLWNDSSNIHFGAESPDDPESVIENEDSSYKWFDISSGELTYNNEILNHMEYPYYMLSKDGTDPSTNEALEAGAKDNGLIANQTDGSIYLLRHFGFKYADTSADMLENMKYLIPYEPVICLENNGLYFFNPKAADGPSMVLIAGGDGSGSSIVDPSGYIDPSTDDSSVKKTTYNVDRNGIFNIVTNDSSLSIKNGIININGTVDSDGILNISQSDNSIDIDNNENLNINSESIQVSNGILNINAGNIDNEKVLNIGTDSEVDTADNTINILASNINNDMLNFNGKIDEDGYLIIK
jgi:hypothetical protein